MTTATIPLTVSDEARARVEELELGRELEAILEHARKTIPELYGLAVSLEWGPELLDAPRVLIDAHRPHLGENERAAQDAWLDWALKTFPPDVLVHLTLVPFFEDTNGR